MPQRIQRLKGFRLPAGSVFVGDPTPWRNPFTVHQRMLWTPAVVIEMYAGFVRDRQVLLDAVRSELAGHDLACWCPLTTPCHADVLIELANGEPS